MQNMFLGPWSDLDEIVEAIRRIRAHAPALVRARPRRIGHTELFLYGQKLTAGYTDRLPDSLFGPAASLPLAVFFQLGTPFPAVQERAYASALVLTIIVLGLSLISRGLTKRFTKHIIR